MSDIFNHVFVTVGTTEFSSLIIELDNDAFLSLLCRKNCSRLTVQIGRGDYEPCFLPLECDRRHIFYTCYRFKPSLKEDMSSSSLIISHAGALYNNYVLCYLKR